MTILLDSTALPGFDHRLTVLDQIESGDLSGETSSTARPALAFAVVGAQAVTGRSLHQIGRGVLLRY